MKGILVFLLLVSLMASQTGSHPTPSSDNSEELERSMRLKSLLHELNGLPDKELRDLLLQLKALRKLRGQTRNVADVPVGQLTEEELMQIAKSKPPLDRKKTHYVPLDIPHDLIRVTLPKPLDVFGVSRPAGGNKVLGENSEDDEDEEKRQESSPAVADEENDLIKTLGELAAALRSKIANVQ